MAAAPPWADLPALACAVALTGAAVRLMDDFLDRARDRRSGRRRVGARLGRAALPYALALLAAGALAEPVAAGTLFLASYSVGMAAAWDERLPTGLPAWAEALVAAGAGLALAGPGPFLSSLGAVAAVQAADDLLDREEDRRSGAANLATSLGTVETAGLLLVALLVALALHPVKAALVLAAAPVVSWALGDGRWAGWRSASLRGGGKSG